LLPSVAIYGKNGGGKSNVIRAFWLATQFIKNAQRTQHEKALIPVIAFSLNDYSEDEPTEFEFVYSLDNVKYWYGFTATREKIIKEYLYHAPKKQKAKIFSREGQTFSFTEDKARRKLISETVAENQLFFSVACTMNDSACSNAMRWFREKVFFSRDYSDIPHQLLDYSNDTNMLKAISEYAKAADLGIEEMQFEINSQEVDDAHSLSEKLPEEVQVVLTQFLQTLSETSNNSEVRLKMGEVTAISMHQGKTRNGESQLFSLELADESDGTRKLMSIAPAIESVLSNGGILLIDEIERELHPILVNFIVSKFQSKHTNPKGAQMIFTTHNTELMNMELLRRDQFYFVDKQQEDGASELYSIREFFTRTTENMRKGYLLGKYGATPDIQIEEVE
jgi:AAA15 family ATPase/GTPase